MWLKLATIRGLMLAFTTILLQNTVKAEEQTTNLSNVSSTVITEPPSNISVQTSLHLQANPGTELLLEMRNTSSSNKLATNGYSIISKEITDIQHFTPLPYSTQEASLIRGIIPTGSIPSNATVAFSTVYRIESSPVISSFNNPKKTVMVVQTSTTSRQEISFTRISMKERNKNSTQGIVSQRHSVSMVIGSSTTPVKLRQLTNSTVLIMPSILEKSRMINSTASAALLTFKSLRPSVVAGTENTSVTLIKATKSYSETKVSRSFYKNVSEKAQMISNSMSVISSFDVKQANNTSMLPNVVVGTENTSTTLIRGTKSYIKTEVSASFYKNISAKAQMNSNSTSEILSFKVKQPNKTAVLEPSPSLESRQNRSKTNVVVTSPVVKITGMLHSKISKSTILLTQNDTMVQHSMSSSELLAHNYTSKFNTTKEKVHEKTANLRNITTSSLVATLPNKTLVPTLMMSSRMYVSPDINAIVNRTTMRSHIPVSGLLTKFSSNQTHIRNNITKFAVTVTPTILPFYKTVTNRTEKIQVSFSVTMGGKFEVNYTMYATSLTNFTKKVEISKKMVEIKPTSTTSIKNTKIQYSTHVSTKPTSSPVKLIVQQFSVTIKITSENFTKEYITSARVFRRKSKEIEEQFDKVFESMKKYLFTEISRFFSGSLGCDLIIHTESEESKPVPVDEINRILNKAKSTKGGFGKFDVGDIDVKEKSPEVQDKDKKKTWGRLPIIVISILAGVCLVLFVMVITQCIQKRHYSHSLADTNEIQEYSPAIQLKYNDDDTFKDEERVPMTTFNQTDIY